MIEGFVRWLPRERSSHVAKISKCPKIILEAGMQKIQVLIFIANGTCYFLHGEIWAKLFLLDI